MKSTRHFFKVAIVFIAIISITSIAFFNLPFNWNSQAAQNNGAGSEVIGSNILKVDEHRISIFQENQENVLLVQDEFWVSNTGNEPFFGYAYNNLPDDITIDEGMFCQVSETGDHICFQWLHENNNYFWAGNYVILPKNYANDFEFVINITSINNQSITYNITKKIDSTTEDLEKLVESDPGGWTREGFEHGWTLIFNFTINNTNNVTDIFEFKNLKVPPGLRFSLYVEANNNGSLDFDDPIIGFESNYDGFWEAWEGYDTNLNYIPDISLKGNESKTFYVYLRADYRLHFLTKYKKSYEPSKDGMITFNKETIYDTTLMRVFVVLKLNGVVKSDSLSFQERQSEDHYFLYGEWSGSKSQEISIELEGEAPSTFVTAGDTINRENGLIITILLIGIVLLVAIMFRVNHRKKLREKERSLRKASKKKSAVKSKRNVAIATSGATKSKPTNKKTGEMEYGGLLEKRAHYKKIINRLKVKEYEDEVEKEMEMEICREFEKKLKSTELAIKKIEAAQPNKIPEASKQRYPKAIRRLEEDYEAGRIDKEIYDELKKNYTINLKP